jgi:uncharacterized phage infection (PIP) family protein YhgE
MSWEIIVPALIGGGVIGAISAIVTTIITVRANQPGLMGRALNDLMNSLKIANETNQNLQTWANKLEQDLEEEKKNSLDRAVLREQKHRDEIEKIKNDFTAANKQEVAGLKTSLGTMKSTLEDYQKDNADNAKKIRALESNLQGRTDDARILRIALKKRDEFIDAVLLKLNAYLLRDGLEPVSPPA